MVIVREATALGVTDMGLGVHTGRSVVNPLEVTAQLNVTGLSKPPVDRTETVAVAVPPGSTPAGGESVEGVSVKLWAWARGVNSNSNRAQRNAGTTGLRFNMNGWELTTFDSSNGANAAPSGTKECRPRIAEKDRRENKSRKSQCYPSPLAKCAKQES